MASSLLQCHNSEGWGPWNPLEGCEADWTPCFEESAMRLIPVAMIAIAGTARLFQLSSQHVLAHIPKDTRQVTKMLLTLGLLPLSIKALYSEGFQRSIESVVGTIQIVSIFYAYLLTIAENRKNRRSSDVLMVYWLLLLAVDGVRLRTELLGCSSSLHRVEWSTALFLEARMVATFVIFLLELLKKKPAIELGDADEVNKCPEDDANIFSIISFSWVSPLMRKGYSNPLTMNDLWQLRKVDQSHEASGHFERTWNKELTKKHPNLVRAIAKAFGRPFYVAGVWKGVNDTLSFIQPILLKEMLRFVMSYKTDEPQPLYRGYTIAFLMFICALSQTAVLHRYFHLCFRVGMHVRSGLVTAIYQKSLRLSNASRQQFTVGEIVNHMSIDSQRVQDLVSYLHIVWSGLFQITMAMVLLYQTMGWAIFAGVLVMILMIPINAKLSGIMRGFQQKQMKNKDMRIKLMNEILNGIRVIKLYAWENTFLQKVLTVRNDQELAMMRKIGYLTAVQSFTWATTPFLVSLSTFAVYALVMKRPMTTDIVFASIALFNLLQFPLSMFPYMISSIVESYVAIQRIQKYLTSSEVDPHAIVIEDYRKLSQVDASDKYMVLVNDATFAWSQEAPPAISNIHFALQKDALLTVIGRVGAGKSSLIAALCGDLERVSGEVRLRGSVAYVPQQAWIMNDTLRANITFGNAYDPAFYQATIEACCLQPDIDMLVDGDMTEIGERGINLSGGQKARISLARAVYARADIYLLDDPLSAVDSHVGRTIFDKVVGPRGLLAGKTRVFVTHHIHYLQQSTRIIMLREGKIVESGDYDELMASRTEVYQLVTEYGHESGNDPSTPVEGTDDLLDNDGDASTPVAEGGALMVLDEMDEEEELAPVDEAMIQHASLPTEEHSLLSSTPRSIRSTPRRRGSTASIRTLRRRPSMPVLAEQPKAVATAPGATNNPLIAEEKSQQGSVERSVYFAYAKACSMSAVVIYVISLLVSQAASIGTQLWLAHWSRNSDNGDRNHGNFYYIMIYASLGMSFSILTVFQMLILLVFCALRSARVLHEDMLRSVLRSPMSFFDTTPIGRILNRFSKDQATVDEVLPRSFSSYTRTLFQVASTLLVVTLSTPSFIIVIFPLAFAYLWLQRYYLATSRELRRLDSVSRSPIFAHFQETLGGISTIRAYRQQQRFIQGNESRIDTNLRAFYPSIAGNRWLAFRLESLSSVIVFGSSFLSVFSLSMGYTVDPGLVGLSLTYALSVTQTLNWMVRQYTEIETNIVSVERLKEYVDLAPEAPEIIEGHRPPVDWPSQGRVDFRGYETRYRPGLELVLRGVTASIRRHEKIGIVGRTGAGKSSLTLALFRIIEAVKGQIMVDDIDISTLGLYDVRSRFSIIPQDPVLFMGTVRFNLDPAGSKTDAELWDSLDKSFLKEYVQRLSGGLDAEVLENGDNFSVGQRQLMCLARALLRKSSILVLDEATSSVDMQTDEQIQTTIRSSFSDRTILTIAHRIKTIMDYDRILVLDKGQVKEFASPATLLKDKTSIFYNLALQAGEISE
ncbi:hypothetical protein DFQ26_003685 [Actinomortierella ambigua]|nr:hypothetical protein DFQ26_003685 [Actinomortierella ambigua]